MSGPANSLRVVIAALLGNLLIALSKFVAAFVTGSAATLAEAVHSVADTGNQVLLLLGMRLSEREASEKHPFGRTIERYFWPFVVSIMLFTVGGAFAIYEGVHKLQHLHEPVVSHGSNLWNYGVLGVSFLFEAYSCTVALSEFNKSRGQKGFFQALTDAKDPTIPVVLMEDIAALVGLGIALLGVGMSDLTGWQGCDGVASLLIGALLCFVAFFLGRETHSLLIGESATVEDRAKARALTESVKGVLGVRQMLTVHRGPEDVLVAMKVEFERTLTMDALEDAINAIEDTVREGLPHMRQIFIEPDSKYDGHADPRPDASVLPPPSKL